jgi:hypothetical protein
MAHFHTALLIVNAINALLSETRLFALDSVFQWNQRSVWRRDGPRKRRNTKETKRTHGAVKFNAISSLER